MLRLYLKNYATKFFFPDMVPKKILYKNKPKTIINFKIIKQPVSKSGFKRGQRRVKGER